MHYGNGKKRTFLKVIIGVIILFLVGIAFIDGTPTQTSVEKTVIYHEP